MTIRSLALFIHVVSSMALFGTMAIEGLLLWRLRRAAGATQMQDALNGFRILRVLAPLTLAPTVGSGMHLVRTVWGWRAAWIDVALISLFLAAAAGVTTTVLRIARLQRGELGGVHGARDQRGDYGRDVILFVSFAVRTAIFIGIVFLMTVKPGLKESLIAIGTATAAGLLASVAVLRGATLDGTHVKPRQVAANAGSAEKSR